MAYEKHDPLGTEKYSHGFEKKEEEDKQDYSKHEHYNSEKDGKGDYVRRQQEEKKEDDKEPSIEDSVKQQGKYKKDSESDDEGIKRKAAEELHREAAGAETAKRKNSAKTIEDAVNKAIKKEKEVVRID